LHLILSHVPELARPGRPLDAAAGAVHLGPGALTAAQARDNAAAIIRALAELSLAPPFRAEDLCSAAFAAEDAAAAAPDRNSFEGANTLAAMMSAIKAMGRLFAWKMRFNAVNDLFCPRPCRRVAMKACRTTDLFFVCLETG
jgi:hypothetical protein